MTNRNLTMGEMSEFMALQETGTANFARKKRRGLSRKRRRSVKSRVIGSSALGRAARLGAVGATVGIGGTKKGRGLVKSGYEMAGTQVGRAKSAAGSAYGAGRQRFLDTRDAVGGRIATNKNWRGKRTKAR